LDRAHLVHLNKIGPTIETFSVSNHPPNQGRIMSVADTLVDAEERMEKAISVLQNNLSGIRTGRATPGLVDSIKVDVYGSSTPLKQLASVGTPEPQQIVIRPYDASTIKEIEKAIVAGDLGLNPQNDGRMIRLNVPALSTEVRQKMVGRIKELAEEAKISIRNIRRDANKAADTAEKAKEIGEDERDTLKDEVQELTKKSEAKASEMAKVREAEVTQE
jgi:ribosome recycling factor